MNKKEMKQIQITDVIVKVLRGGSDMSGEWHSNVNVEFLLDTPQTFEVFNQTHVIDRIAMFSGTWDDNIHFRLATETMVFENLEVSKIFIHKIYSMLNDLQQKGGKFEGWDFREYLFEILSDDHYAHCINAKQKLDSIPFCY